MIGGAIMSMASHGTDQLLVQRVLAARTLGDARKALVGSGIMVGCLFALLSLVGMLLWARNDERPLSALGLSTSDALFPDFIVHDLPPGLTGLLVAGLLSATMGSLSATLNAMASATLLDFAAPCRVAARYLRVSPAGFARLVTVLWAVVLVVAALVLPTAMARRWCSGCRWRHVRMAPCSGPLSLPCSARGYAGVRCCPRSSSRLAWSAGPCCSGGPMGMPSPLHGWCRWVSS
ncbi:hypothetical protein RAA17_12880 [Komagataeibacter rhaeticus]|nr:hypothetical protein [Komagataeibacter rhaeticus]